MFKEWIQEHRFKLQALAIVVGISFVIGLAATGDLSEAFARMRGR